MSIEDVFNMVDSAQVLPDVVSRNKQFINSINSLGIAPLHSACLSAHPVDVTLQQVELLLGCGADIEMELPHLGIRPLHCAAQCGDAELLGLLLRRGAQVNSLTPARATPLSVAVQYLRYDNAALLRANGGSTELGMAVAAECGDITRVKEIAGDRPETINSTCEDHYADTVAGNTPLHYAARGRSMRAITESVPQSRIPSRTAVVDMQLHVVDFLCRQGADIHARNESGVTPIFYAASEGYHEIVDMLIGFGSNVNSPTDANGTPLLVASRLGHIDTVRLLLERSADPNIQSTSGNTPMKLALEGGHDLIAALLHQYGATR